MSVPDPPVLPDNPVNPVHPAYPDLQDLPDLPDLPDLSVSTGPGFPDAPPLSDLGPRLTVLACLTTLTFTKRRIIANPQNTLQLY